MVPIFNNINNNFNIILHYLLFSTRSNIDGANI